MRSEVLRIPDDPVTIVATGPLTSEPLADEIAAFVGRSHLHFFDAVSPVVEADSIDFEIDRNSPKIAQARGRISEPG